MRSYEHAISEARTMRDLVPVAMAILRDMSDGRKLPVVQVCGPITTGGFENLDKNLAVFHIGIRVLKERGLNVFNQTIFQNAIIRITGYRPDDVVYKTEILKDFFRDIFASGYITTGFFIPNWRSSIGSCWEHGMLSHLCINRVEMQKDWFYGTF